MNARTPITIADPAIEALNGATHASLCRAIEGCPVENKLKCFI
jgi:hypothetical protein